MNKRDLLLEIGLEEMPARVITDSINQLTSKITTWLSEQKIAFGEVKSFSTPRRLSVLILDIAEKQEDVHFEAKGPAKKIALDADGNWTKAAVGFTRGQGSTIEDIYFKDVNGIDYVHVNKFVKGENTETLLPHLKQIIINMSFPKNMRWGIEELKFVRPIKWIVAMYGMRIIPISITNVESNNKSRGHRFLGADIEFSEPREYKDKLLEQHVIADSIERKEAIRTQIRALEEENNWVVPVDEDLLEEVNNLVEYPTALFGKYEDEFLSLPEEVLITTMKEHQRYFPVKDKRGTLLPYFITVRNGNDQFIGNVSKGNEKVLRARLSDADFFFKEDQKLQVDDAIRKLDSIVYHEELGSMGDKIRRIREIAKQLTDHLQVDQQTRNLVDRTAQICKFDLVTHMVYEFPELQGIMGEKYAKLSGENENVVIAINEHYMPKHAADKVPSSEIGAIVSIADKIDTIIGCFSIGIIPTGSQDPYALRRQAAGIVKILAEKKWSISLETLVEITNELFRNHQITKKTQSEVVDNLVQFFKMRIKHELTDRGIRYDIIDAVLGSDIGNISALIARADVLEKKKVEPTFKQTVESLSRVITIAKKGNEMEVNSDLFEADEEAALFEKFKVVKAEVNHAFVSGDFDHAFQSLASMKNVIDTYFDRIMVMSENEEVKNNRLALMIQMSEVITAFANMNVILVK